MVSSEEENIEPRARRAARRAGLLAVKSRQRACVWSGVPASNCRPEK